MKVYIYDRASETDEPIAETTITVPSGTVMTESYLGQQILSASGYDPRYGVEGEAAGKTAQGGETYTCNAYIMSS